MYDFLLKKMASNFRPLAGCDVMRLATFSQFKWNFQRPLAGCNEVEVHHIAKAACFVLRPLAGCDLTFLLSFQYRYMANPTSPCGV